MQQAKKFEYYNSLSYKMEITSDQNGYVVSFPELPGCVAQGKTLISAIKNSASAKKKWLLSAINDNIKIAEPKNLESFSGELKIRLPKTLHKKLLERSKRENVSMNQYCIYLLSKEN